jgi:hypothetical protein
VADALRPHAPAGGWAAPWPDVAELAAAVPSDAWTLIGGLMVQLHAVAAGLPVVRPTNDVDVLLHLETGRGRASAVACVDPFEERTPSGSDRSRLLHLRGRLADPTAPWLLLPGNARRTVRQR